MGGSAAISLSLLCLGPERKVKCYNGYFVNGYVFHNEEYEHGRKTYNSGVCIKGSTSSEFEVDYYDWKRSSNCNIIASKIECFYSNAIGMTQLTEESE
jgi:hypothetical protein